MRKLWLSASLLLVAGVALVGCGRQLPTEIARSADSGTQKVFDLAGDCELTIGDRVWRDVNMNGIQDPGEPGIAGAGVKLINASTKDPIAMTTTDEHGFYEFGGLCPGEYEVTVTVKDCWLTKAFAGAPDVDSNMNPAYVKLQKSDDTIDFGFVCKDEPPMKPCEPCKGGVNELTLRYNGPGQVDVVVSDKKGGQSKKKASKKNKKNGAILFEGPLAHGMEFTFVGAGKDGKMGTNIVLIVDGVVNATIHTSCSQPIGPGLIFGDFEVIAASSVKGGPICPGPPPPPPGQDDLCETFGRPAAIELLYTADDCSAVSHDQASGKASCTDAGPMPPVAHIVASDSSTPGQGDVWFDGIVAEGGTFVVDAAHAGQNRLSTNTWLHIYSGQTLVQTVQFHTSCSQPLHAGDVFGGVELVHILR